MTRGLEVAPGFFLPVDSATGTFGILATKGSGKSNAAVVMAEEMYDAGVPWVAVDPKGDWWGIRADGDGKGAGLPIVVFGGRHGDVPLEPTAGALIADLVLEQRLSCVVDVSQFTKADTTRFLLAFGRRLFAHADDDGAEPLHLFLEEAHEYLPQVVRGDQAELVNVWQRIVKQGRFKGLGCTLISQRSSVLNKDVLELIDTLIVLRTMGPRSRKSISDWVVDQDVDPKLLASLPSLADGEAWVWSPGALKILEKVRFRRRRTFDSGATPKVGQARRAPATLADVDLAAIKEQMAETIERAKADHPKELRRQIATLRKELGTRPTETVEREVEKIVHVPVIDSSVADLIKQAFEPINRLHAALQDAEAALSTIARQPHERTDLRTHTRTRSVPQSPKPQINALPRRDTSMASDGSLPGPQRKLLTVLATYGPRTKRQLALLAGYSIGGGGFNNPLGALRSSGLVQKGEPIAITDAGISALGDYDSLPTGRDLLDHWLSSLPGPCKKILSALVDRWPDSYTKDDLAEAAGYAPVGGGFNNPLGRLRTLELVTRGSDIRLTDDFGEAIS